MSRDDNRHDPPGFTEFLPLTTGIHAWVSHPHPHGPSFGSTNALPPRSQTIPSFFPSGALGAQSHPAAHGPERQMTLSNIDQPPFPARRTSLPILPSHPPPAHLTSGPPYTHRNSFPGQYNMSPHFPPFQSQPFQPHMYYGYHPLESTPYSQIRYFPVPEHQPPPCFQYRPNMEGSNPSHQQPQHLPPPIPHSPVSSPVSSRAGSYGPQQYLPPLYTPTSQFGLPQQYQPNVYPWYYGPGLSVNTFNKGFPMQVQQYYPTNYSPPQTRPLRRDSTTLTTQSTDSERLPSPSLGTSGKPIAVTTSHTTSPPAANPAEQHYEQNGSKIDTRELNKSTTTTSRIHDHPPVRRHYHPNPPPNRSEWVMWVGNVPSDAAYEELWRFLKYPTPTSSGSDNGGKVEGSGVMSIFLISRSNCAFVNYQSEEHLNRAIAQFYGRQLRPHDRRCPRLVCRARRKADDLRAGVGAQRGMGVHTRYVKNTLQKSNNLSVEMTVFSKGSQSTYPYTMSVPPLAPSVSRDEESLKSDTVEGMSPKVPTRSPSSYASTTSSVLVRHFPRRFFILKSLTQYDLDLSVERGMWATQKHNEAILDQAFRTSEEVTLIFSVNKSGEFYGYAQMASNILRSSHSLSWAPRLDSSPSKSGVVDPGNPGLHLQPLAEDVHGASDVEEDAQPESTAVRPVATHGHSEAQQREESWGEAFKVEWLCTERVAFDRTRHLRNPWNHNREIKVSRDGTELEPLVGRQLIEEWPTLAHEAVDNDARRTTASSARTHAPKSVAASLAL